MREYEGWALKNKYGTILLWTVGRRRKDVLNKFNRNLKELKKIGYKIVKVRIIEI